MLESIIELGEIATKGSNSFLSTIIKKLEPKTKKGEQRYVCKVIFDTKNNLIKLDCDEEISEDTAEKYNYIGNAQANSPKWYCAVTDYKYIFTDTFVELGKRDFDERLNKKIIYVNQNFVNKVNEEGKQLNKVDMSKVYGIGDLKIEEHIKKISNSVKDSIGLYVVYVDDICIPRTQEYEYLLIEEKQGKVNEKKRDIDNSKICFYCGAKEEILDEVQMNIKYYIEDKVSFASQHEKNNFYKNFSLCKNCYMKLQSGEVYLKNKLETQFLKMSTYLLPHFIFGENITKEKLDKISLKLKNSLGILEKIEDIYNFQVELENSLYASTESDIYYLVNIIFFEKSNSATKIKSMIKDIHVNIFREIFNNIKITNEYFKEYASFRFNLESIYLILPKYKSTKGGYSLFTKQVIEIANSIFNKSDFSEQIIIELGLKRVRQEVYSKTEDIRDKQKYKYIDKYKDKLVYTVILINKLIYFMKLQNSIKRRGDIMKLQININKPEIEEYIQNSGMDEEKTGLFLLGCLTAEIASAQRERGKVILNKLNYSGMDYTKVIQFANTVFEKLRQEKILSFNELLYGECMKFLNMEYKKLNKKENLYYILSGYSIMTSVIIKNAIDKKEQKELETLRAN